MAREVRTKKQSDNLPSKFINRRDLRLKQLSELVNWMNVFPRRHKKVIRKSKAHLKWKGDGDTMETWLVKDSDDDNCLHTLVTYQSRSDVSRNCNQFTISNVWRTIIKGADWVIEVGSQCRPSSQSQSGIHHNCERKWFRRREWRSFRIANKCCRCESKTASRIENKANGKSASEKADGRSSRAISDTGCSTRKVATYGFTIKAHRETANLTSTDAIRTKARGEVFKSASSVNVCSTTFVESDLRVTR